MAISYLIKQSKRSRRVRIAVSGGRVVVTAPMRIGKEYLDRLVASHGAWIERAIRKHEKLTAGISLAHDTFDHREFASMVKAMVKDRYTTIAAPCGVRLGKISVKKMRSRWGSCSGQGNVSINLLLGKLPEELLEYVVIHELCHLVHHNHSKSFWSLVGKYAPEYKSRKRELRRYGHFLAKADPPRNEGLNMVK
jgi:Predicted metal-dependent hydrolase